MELVVNFLQFTGLHLSVNLRGLDACVPQHFLDQSQVRPPSKKMRRKGMSQRVGADFAIDSCSKSISLDQFPNRLASHALTSAGQNEPRRFGELTPRSKNRPLFFQVNRDCFHRALPSGHHPLLAPFSFGKTITFLQMNIGHQKV